MSARKPTNCSTPSIHTKTNAPSRLSASTVDPQGVTAWAAGILHDYIAASQRCIIPGCTGTKLEGRKYCAAHQERANGQTLAEKVKEQRAALAVVADETAHPDTDEHRAGCTHCQYVHDSKQPDTPEGPSFAAAFQMGYDDGIGDMGMTFDDDPESPRSRAYDFGRTMRRSLEGLEPAQAQESKTWTPDSNPRRRKEDQPGSARTYFIKADECVRLCEALAAFWGDCCDAPIWPGAYLTEEETPIRDLVRAAVGLNPLGWKAGAGDPLTAADARLAAEDDRKTPPPMGEDDMERDRR